jgi:hypothetical protein
MRYPSRIVTFGLVLLAAACDAPTSAPDLAPPEVALQDLQVVARSVATAMQSDGARLAVRDALRDSPWSEHKVVFQELLRSDAGGPLLEAAARAGGESVSSASPGAARRMWPWPPRWTWTPRRSPASPATAAAWPTR